MNLDDVQHFVTCGKHGEPLRQDLDGGNEARQDIFHIQIKIVLETEESLSRQPTHTHVDEHTNKKHHKRQN